MLHILYHFPSTVMGSELLLCHAMVHHHELLGGAQSETKCLGCLLIGSDGLFSSFPGGGQHCHIISKLALSDEVMVGSSSAPPEKLLVKPTEHFGPDSFHFSHPFQPPFNHHTSIQIKQSGCQGAALSQAILHLNPVQQFLINTYTGLHVVVDTFDDFQSSFLAHLASLKLSIGPLVTQNYRSF